MFPTVLNTPVHCTLYMEALKRQVYPPQCNFQYWTNLSSDLTPPKDVGGPAGSSPSYNNILLVQLDRC